MTAVMACITCFVACNVVPCHHMEPKELKRRSSLLLWQVVALRELCLETIISDVLTNGTVLELLEVADKLHCEELLSACLEYLTDKYNR